MTDIFSRLPVKSLLRFRCVSKSWLSLISSPEFETNYLEVSTTRSCRRRLIFCSATALHTCPLYEPLSIDDEPCDFTKVRRLDNNQIVGSCNGLVCLVCLYTGNIFVWNPAIRKHRQLPFPLRFSSWQLYGFGYDASSDDYKVVHIVHAQPNSPSYSRTYSLRNDSWKSSDWSHGTTPFGGPGVFLNGAIHWIVGCDDMTAVVAQSLETGEVFWRVAFPLQSRVTSAFLQVSGERLCLCFECGLRMEFWVMEEYGVEKSWSKVFCLDESRLRRKTLLVTKKRVNVTTRTYKSLLTFLFFENGDFYRYLECKYVTAATYGESFVNPNKTW